MPTDQQLILKQFADLFQGNERCHGETVLSSQESATASKVQGSSVTVHRPINQRHIVSHLAGKGPRLGIPPLRDDGTTVFAAIDIDIKDNPGFDLAAFARKVYATIPGAIPCRSKSGGCHVYRFSAQPSEARRVRESLASWTVRLGLPKSTERFPKQDTVDASKDQYPNWIHIPYHGSDKTDCYALKPDGSRMSIEEFVTTATALKARTRLIDDEPQPSSVDSADSSEPVAVDDDGQSESTSIDKLLQEAAQYKGLLNGRPVSGRNEAGLWLWCQIRDAGYSHEEALDVVDRWVIIANETRPGEPYTSKEAQESLEQAYKRPAREKRLASGKQSKDKVALSAESEIRKSSILAVDAVGQVYEYNTGTGRYEFDEHKKFQNILKAKLAASNPPFQMAKADADKLMLNLGLSDTPEFWKNPPQDRINLANGILNLETLDLESHSPAFRFPNQFNVAWDPNAECPKMDAFLGAILALDEVALFYEMLGLTLVPDLSFQTAFLLWGTGANGKSQFMSMLQFMLGTRNYSTIPLDKLEANTFAAHGLVGKLANFEADLTINKLPGSATFKRIVGGDPINVEKKYKDAYDVQLYTRLFISCNRFPRSADNSPGFFRRWLVLPFDKKNFDGPDSDERVRPRHLLPQLQGEASGILNKAVRALIELRKRDGFTETLRMREAKRSFKSLTDSLSVWLDENTIIGNDFKVPVSQLRSAYNRFCDSKGLSPLDEKEFSTKVMEYRPSVKPSAAHGTRYYSGIGLRADTSATTFPPEQIQQFELRNAEHSNRAEWQ